MSRCFICDYSQSADSIYNDGVLSHTTSNNRVVFNAALGKDICIACLEHQFQQNNYWTAIDGVEDDVPETETDTDASEYCGCTGLDAD